MVNKHTFCQMNVSFNWESNCRKLSIFEYFVLEKIENYDFIAKHFGRKRKFVCILCIENRVREKEPRQRTKTLGVNDRCTDFKLLFGKK